MNGSKGCAKDPCRTPLCKKIKKSGSLPCPFKLVKIVLKVIHFAVSPDCKNSPYLDVVAPWMGLYATASKIPAVDALHRRGELAKTSLILDLLQVHRI
jgi:hypothetical protein